MQRRDKIVTRAIYRAWPMRITLPDLGPSFSVEAIAAGHTERSRAVDSRFVVRPGVYVLGARGPVDRTALPSHLGPLRFDEYHAPRPDPLGARVTPLALPQHVSGHAVEIGARVVSDSRPDSVTVWLRPLGAGWFRPFSMRPVSAYEYRATIPGDSLPEGEYKYVISVRSSDSVMTFPDRIPRAPWDWDFQTETFWRTSVVRPDAPLRLLSPEDDVAQLAFTRIGDAIRQGIFAVIPSAATGEPAIRLTLPVNVGGLSPEDYTASLVIKDRIASRGDAIARATGIRLKVRGVGARQRLHVTLMEKDGTSWSTAVTLDSTWAERTVPLSGLRAARGVKLPLGYPGTWNYWVEPALGRGGTGDRLRVQDVERLQLSLRREEGVKVEPGRYGVIVESVSLVFR
jgi:hypothetical protein